MDLIAVSPDDKVQENMLWLGEEKEGNKCLLRTPGVLGTET